MAEEAATERLEAVATCAFFVQRKHRRCKAAPAEGRSYCIEHSHLESTEENRKRIPCPLDPKHTVFEDRLEKHLKKCNARPKDLPPYHVLNVNSGAPGLDSDATFELDLKDVPSGELIKLTEKISMIYDGLDVRFKDFRGRCHRCVDAALSDGGAGGTKRGRHLVQVGALLAVLDSAELLTRDTVFVEFGAGRGELAHWVKGALPIDAESCYVLVDRASPRHKFDWKHKWGDGPMFHRLRIDIEHLDLSKVSAVPRGRPLVCLSKHLCGDATDLTLRCLANFADAVEENDAVDSATTSLTAANDEGGSSPEKRCRLAPGSQRLAGILVALCCHHRCSWRHFCGREALQKLGLTARDFHLLTRMATWATCGAKDAEGGVHPRFGSLSAADREKIGRKCKRLIDFGRLKFLERRFPEVALCYYVDEKESLENVAIFAHH